MTALVFAFVYITFGGAAHGLATFTTYQDCQDARPLYEAEGATTSECFARATGNAPMPHVMEGV